MPPWHLNSASGSRSCAGRSCGCCSACARSPRDWQVGDGREEAVAPVRARERARRATSTTRSRTIDEFGYEQSFLINVGDEKGEILDAAISRRAPKRLLELGTYCGYSALRTARAMPAGRAPRLDRVQRRQRRDRAPDLRSRRRRRSGDRRRRDARRRRRDLDALEAEHGFARRRPRLRLPRPRQGRLPSRPRADHRPRLAAPRLARRRRQRQASRRPGVPRVHAGRRGKLWRTTEHETHAEYQTLLKDLVLESEYLGS